MTIKEINENISKNLDFICLKKKMDKSEFIKDLINHFSSANASMKIGKEIIYQMVNGGRKNNRNEDPVPVSFGIDRIHAVCEYLGVSIDGLISRDKPLSPDTDLQGACKYTRLSEEAIGTLRNRWVSINKDTESEWTKQLNDLITGFLLQYNNALFEYRTAVHEETENLDYFDECIQKRWKSFSRNNSPEWAMEEERVVEELMYRFKEYAGKRKTALFEIQEIAVGYAKTYTKTEEVEKKEGILRNKVMEHGEAFFPCFTEEVERGTRNGEHNENK